jgi:exodeoxyribonuclease-3
MSGPFSVATWNVNGIRARQAQFAEWIERDKPDVVCLQEIKAAPDKVPELVCNLAGYHCYWHGQGGYSGVALHARKDRFSSPPAFAHPAFDRETRIVIAPLPGVTVASVYVPNGGKDYPAKLEFLDALEAWVAERQAAGEALIVCGDINIAHTDRDVHERERKAGVIGQREEERARFDRLLGHGLVDVGRKLDPDNDHLFTWWAPWRNMRQRNIGWRIDYLLASCALADRATACRVLADVGTSDHAPVLATFAI